MPTYRTATKEVTSLISEVMNQYHPDLEKAGVTVSALFADELRHHGYSARATIKINSVKDRIEGKADCTLTICEPDWEEMSAEERSALIDHEETHLILVRDEDKRVKYDQAERPKLKMREHDFQGGYFFEVAERHKESSPEAVSYKPLQARMRQLLLFEDS
jgi:hypothetical protein